MKRRITALVIIMILSGASLFAEEILRPKVEYTAEGLRDPFKSPLQGAGAPLDRPGYETQSQLPALVVQGIVWGVDMPQAIINKKIVKEGETIEGARVVKISREGVTVLFGDNEYKLSTPAVETVKSKDSMQFRQ